MWLRLIWSRTHLIPGLPVPHFLSPWTNGPQKFGPHGQMVPNQFGPPGQTVPIKFGPHGQMVPNQFGPHTSKSSQLVPLDKQNILGTICPGGPNWLGTICPGDQIFGDHLSRGPNFWGPFVHIGWGPFVQGDQIGWGPFDHGDQIFGDHLSIGTEFGGDLLSRRMNFIGITCLGRQEVGDQKSRDQMVSGPNAPKPHIIYVVSSKIAI